MSLILPWQKRVSALYQHGVGLSGSVAVPKRCLVSAAPCGGVRVLGCRMGPSYSFQRELFSPLINKGVAPSA